MLHKQTNYKSNYTSLIYMKVNASLCNGEANQREEQGWHDDFSPEVHVFANTLVPVVSTAHLVVRRLIGITRQARTSGTARTYLESEVAQWHALLELLFEAPMRRAQCP